MDGAAQGPTAFFISRAGKNPVDVAMAAKIDAILRADGHRTVLQQFDFANRNFMERMDTALASGARIVAILSPEYQATDYCAAEWMHALAGDPLNKKGRLIVLRAAETEPRGLLRTIGYWDLVSAAGSDAALAAIVRAAVLHDAERRHTDPIAKHWREARPLIHELIKPTPGFTGRDGELLRIDGTLWSGNDGVAAITQPVSVSGLGGIGKSTLAREYGWQAQDGYAGVWWLNAASEKDAASWGGVEQGLVALGDHYLPGLARSADRAAAAREALRVLASGSFSKPWLLIFDNVDNPTVLDVWRPQGNVKTLVTTRLTRIARGVIEVEIKEWAMPDAVRYLLAESARADLTEHDARAIAEALGRLPLALSHAAAYLRDTATATPQGYLAAIGRHMGRAPRDVDYDRAVYATFMEQVAAADVRAPGARDVLSLAAYYEPDEVPEDIYPQPPEN